MNISTDFTDVDGKVRVSADFKMLDGSAQIILRGDRTYTQSHPDQTSAYLIF